MSKIISNTLSWEVETWDDPGDYPNSLASGPQPSYQYYEHSGGELVLELTEKEKGDAEVEDSSFVKELLDSLFREQELGIPPEVDEVTWNWNWCGSYPRTRISASILDSNSQSINGSWGKR
jgi:hypothetical protein